VTWLSNNEILILYFLLDLNKSGSLHLTELLSVVHGINLDCKQIIITSSADNDEKLNEILMNIAKLNSNTKASAF
jgi:hypothetical protein